MESAMFTATFTWFYVSGYRNFGYNEKWKSFNFSSSLASFNCFTQDKLFLNGANTLSKVVLKTLVPLSESSQIFISCSSNTF